ncbi:Hypothetical predicted protein [Cloeon dipterum]|uniref:Uncharacterized protein n=1 Tax=Cloeon dipterum TaxID=197152 RepID=A0A8S1CQH6_9INSE|nr:Hypothetical predicted protein [Cloeon dipterum]
MPLHVLARRCSQSKKTSFGGASPSKLMPSLITSLEILAKVSDTNCEDHRRRTPLHILVKTNCSTSEPYLSLLTHGSQLDKQNERGETPLIEALENSSLFAAELLLEEAAKTQSDHQWLCRSTQYGETALHVAARKGLTNIVASILSLNSSASATMLQDLNGDSALHLAAGRYIIKHINLIFISHFFLNEIFSTIFSINLKIPIKRFSCPKLNLKMYGII